MTSGGGLPAESITYTCTGAMASRVSGGNTWNYGWDERDRLVSVQVTGQPASTNLYTASGQRIIRRDPDGTTIVYLGNTELRQPAIGTPQVARIYGHGVIRTETGAVTYQAAEHHGSIVATLEPATGAKTQTRYHPYGNRRAGLLRLNRGFLNKTEDTRQAFSHLDARSYQDTLATFSKPDPLLNTATPASLNPYMYGHANPLTLSDPTGLLVEGDSAPPNKWTPSNPGAPRYNYTPPPPTPVVTYNDYGQFSGVSGGPGSGSAYSPPPVEPMPYDGPDIFGGLANAADGAWDAAYGTAETGVGVAKDVAGCTLACGFGYQPNTIKNVVKGVSHTVTNPTQILKDCSAKKTRCAGELALALVGGAAGRAARARVPTALNVSDNVIVTASRSPAGVADHFVSEAASSGKGVVWRAPGSAGNANTVRIMESTAQYSNGYARFYNQRGQPIGLDGKPGPNAVTHIPLSPDGTFQVPKGWGAG